MNVAGERAIMLARLGADDPRQVKNINCDVVTDTLGHGYMHHLDEVWALVRPQLSKPTAEAAEMVAFFNDLLALAQRGPPRDGMGLGPHGTAMARLPPAAASSNTPLCSGARCARW